jgi:N-acetylglucosaminyldiphosphoundecaprenol N-acetyl-beta-D-mannosaminyltransferase
MQRRMGLAATRIPGPDLMPKVVDEGRARGLRHFLFGSTEQVAGSVQVALEETFPGARVVGRSSPAFSEDPRAFSDAVGAIQAADPDIVWCALGAPKQELWMERFAPEVETAVFLGVGAAFDFLAASKRRAPAWMQRRGLEWLHRLASEPKRLGGRYVRTNSEFLLRSAYELTRARLAP